MRKTQTGWLGGEEVAVEFGEFVHEQRVGELVGSCHAGRFACEESEWPRTVQEVAQGKESAGRRWEGEHEKCCDELRVS